MKTRRIALLAGVLGMAAIGGVMAIERSDAPAATDAQRDPHSAPASIRASASAVWPPSGTAEIVLWPDGVPAAAASAKRPERTAVVDTPGALVGRTSAAIYDVSRPTMTIWRPSGRNTGAAMVVLPGGGFKAVVVTLEGTEVCNWITSLGITCVLVKYRVPGTGHHWDETCGCAVTPKVPRALQDAQRAIRLVRSKAAQLQLDPSRIGVIGFSAGGYLAVQASNTDVPAYAAVDAADRLSSRPDFAVVVYPGHLCRRGGVLDPGVKVSDKTPPTFLLQAWDDPVDPVCNSTLYARALNAAGVPAEVHLFAKGGHAFGLRRNSHNVTVWPSLVRAWLGEIGILRTAR